MATGCSQKSSDSFFVRKVGKGAKEILSKPEAKQVEAENFVSATNWETCSSDDSAMRKIAFCSFLFGVDVTIKSGD